MRLREKKRRVSSCSRTPLAHPSSLPSVRRVRAGVVHVHTSRKVNVSTKSRTRSKTRLSRALGIALTPKAAKFLAEQVAMVVRYQGGDRELERRILVRLICLRDRLGQGPRSQSAGGCS